MAEMFYSLFLFLIVIVIIKNVFLAKSFQKASARLMIDGSGQTLIKLNFTPARCMVSFISKPASLSSCNYDRDEIFAQSRIRGVYLQWKVGQPREVSWRAET